MSDQIMLNFTTVIIFIVFFMIYYTEYIVKTLLNNETKDRNLIKWLVYLIAIILLSFTMFAMITYYGK